jgi:putative zinc finger protein
MAMNERDSGPSIYAELPCAAVKERLHLFLENEADALTGRSIREHLGRCATCAEEARRIEEERLAFLEAAVVSPALSSRFADRVVEEIRRQEAEALGQRRISRLRAIIAASALAAGFALLSLAGLFTAPASGPGQAPEKIAGSIAGNIEEGRPAPSLPVSLPIAGPSARLAFNVPVTPSVRVCPELPAAPASLHLNLPDSIDYSADFFWPRDPRPCQRDVNQDGQTDISDAAHLFMLAVNQSPAEMASERLDDIDLDCGSLCQI